MEKEQKEADLVPVKSKAYLAGSEATRMRMARTRKMPVNAGSSSEMCTVDGNTTDMETGPNGVKTEQTAEAMEDLLLTQDESIYFGGLSVDV
jgi:hypothetical protein